VGEACILMGKLCIPLFCGNICVIYQANVPAFSFCHFLIMNGDIQDKGSDTPSSLFICSLRCTDSDLWLCKACEGCLDFNFITGCDECYTALSLCPVPDADHNWMFRLPYVSTPLFLLKLYIQIFI